VAQLTVHGDIITPLPRTAPRPSLALGLTPARAGPVHTIGYFVAKPFQWISLTLTTMKCT